MTGLLRCTLARRTLLRAAGLAGLGMRLARGDDAKCRIGITDWNLRLGAKPEAVPLAARLGFEGVQVSFGRRIVDDKMPGDNPETVARYLSLSREHKLPLDGTYVDKLHDNGLKSDKLAVVVKEIRWLGKDRICQIHLKDNPNYLGEGRIPIPAVMQAIREIGFTGYSNLETDARWAATLEADQRRNLGYVRGLMG